MTIKPVYPQSPIYQTKVEDNDIINQAVKKIVHVTIDIFQKIESCVLPGLTKLTRSRGIAEAILYGSLSGLVTRLVFVILELPTNNVRLNVLAYCISYQYFRPDRESRHEVVGGAPL